MGTAILGIAITVMGLILFWVDQRKISSFWRRFIYPGIILLLLTGITMMVHGVNDASLMRSPGGEILRDFLQAGSDRVLPGDYDLTGSIKGYTPNPVYVGDAVTFTYSVRNDGKDKVPKLSYMVKFYVDDKCVSSNGLTMALRSGAGYTCRMGKGYHDFVAERAGEHTYKLEITTRDGLVDANPENNVITGKLLVRESRAH
jgi:hypothetical protein